MLLISPTPPKYVSTSIIQVRLANIPTRYVPPILQNNGRRLGLRVLGRERPDRLISSWHYLRDQEAKKTTRFQQRRRRRRGLVAVQENREENRDRETEVSQARTELPFPKAKSPSLQYPRLYSMCYDIFPRPLKAQVSGSFSSFRCSSWSKRSWLTRLFCTCLDST